MSNADFINPAQAWPFLIDSINTLIARSVALSIYDIRLSLVLPRQSKYVASGKWFSVSLKSCLNNNLTFVVKNDITASTYTVLYINGHFIDPSSILDISNCFVDMALHIPDAALLNLLICALCLLLTVAGAHLTLSKSPIHRKAVLEPFSLRVNMRLLVFRDGYNTQLSYTDGVLSVNVLPGLGTQRPFSYKYWSLYSLTSDSDTYIKKYRNGARSVNGISGSVLITQGPSVSITPKLSNKTLTLQISVNKA